MAKGTGRRKLRINRWVALAFGAFVAGGLALIPMLAGAAVGVGTVTVNPTSVTAGSSTALVFTFMNGTGNATTDVQITVPSTGGWTAPTTGATGNVADVTPNGECTVSNLGVSGSNIRFRAACSNGTKKAQIQYTTTATTAGSYTFTTGTKATTASTYDAIATSPTVSVTAGPLAALSFQSPPSSATYGQTFGLSVKGTDANSNAVSGASVTLSGSSGSNFSCSGGMTTATASNGVASFTGCAFASTGSRTVTATSGSITTSTNISVSAVTLSATGAPQPPAATAYFRCVSGTGHFSAPMTFHVTNIPTGTNGASTVSLTFFSNSTPSKTMATGGASTLDIPLSTSDAVACPSPTNSAYDIPFTAKALTGSSAVIGQSSGATVHVSTFDS